MRVVIRTIQILTGFVFVLSALAKANDPIGMTLLLQNYFSYVGIYTGPDSMAVTGIAILLSVAEVVLGALLLVGSMPKRTTKVLVGVMIPLTLLTLFIVVTSAVPECGCFGSALELTNSQSFVKNIILLAFALALLVRYKQMYTIKYSGIRTATTISAPVLIAIMAIWTWGHLPLVDFTPYAEGKEIPVDLADFALFSEDDEDYTEQILTYPDTTMLLIVASESTAKIGDSDYMNEMWDIACDKHQPFYLVMSEDSQATERFKDKTGLSCPVLYGSREMLQTMIRSNPGLVILQKGRIVEKKHMH